MKIDMFEKNEGNETEDFRMSEEVTLRIIFSSFSIFFLLLIEYHRDNSLGICRKHLFIKQIKSLINVLNSYEVF